MELKALGFILLFIKSLLITAFSPTYSSTHWNELYSLKYSESDLIEKNHSLLRNPLVKLSTLFLYKFKKKKNGA